MEHIAVKLNLSSIEYVCFMKLNQNVLLPPMPIFFFQYLFAHFVKKSIFLKAMFGYYRSV